MEIVRDMLLLTTASQTKLKLTLRCDPRMTEVAPARARSLQYCASGLSSPPFCCLLSFPTKPKIKAVDKRDFKGLQRPFNSPFH